MPGRSPACGTSALSDRLGLNVQFISRYCPYSRPKAFNACERFIVVSGDLGGRKDPVVDGRMAIRNEKNRISEGHSAPSGRVDAEFALKAADD
jgi:hypothetical protein